MANIRFGVAIADARGSIGGTVFSRGKGGAIIRNRTKGVNPRSALQGPRRANLAYLATAWSKTLTAQERLDWQAYAAGTTWTNKLGDSIQINGNSAFIRYNTLVIQAGGAIHKAAPTAMGHAGGITVTFTADTTLKKINITAIGGACDILVVTNSLLFYQAPPVEVGRVMVPTAFRYLGLIEGATPTPLPKAFDSKWTMTAGQRIFIKAIFIDTPQRISPDAFQSVIAAPI